MARTKKEIIEKICQMDKYFVQYAREHPEVSERLPEGAIVVFEDPNDPEFNEECRRLAQIGKEQGIAAGEGDKPIVYITIKEEEKWPPRKSCTRSRTTSPPSPLTAPMC